MHHRLAQRSTGGSCKLLCKFGLCKLGWPRSLRRMRLLVHVMASGINSNNVWPVLGVPLDMVKVQQRNDAPSDFHDGWQRRFRHRLGHSEAVTNARVVEHVVLHCGMCDVNAPFIQASGGPIISAPNRIWGYETNWGSFAQFTKRRRQL